MIPSMEMVRELATLEPGVPVLSLHIYAPIRGTLRTPLQRRSGWSNYATDCVRWPTRRMRKNRVGSGWPGTSCPPEPKMRCSRWIPATGHEDKRGSSRRTAL